MLVECLLGMHEVRFPVPHNLPPHTHTPHPSMVAHACNFGAQEIEAGE